MDELSCYDAPVRPTGGSLAEICLNDLPVGSTGIPCKARANQCSVGLAFGLRVVLFSLSSSFIILTLAPRTSLWLSREKDHVTSTSQFQARTLPRDFPVRLVSFVWSRSSSTNRCTPHDDNNNINENIIQGR